MDENNPIIKHAQSGGGTIGGLGGGSNTDNPILQHAGKADSNLSFGVSSSTGKALFGDYAPLVPRNQDSALHLAKTNKSAWDVISENLMKPVSLVAVASEQLGKTIGHAATGDFGSAGQDLMDTPGKLGGILTGSLHRSFLNVYQDNWKGAGLEFDDKGGTNFAASFANDFFPRILGTITDIAADPLNYIGVNSLTKEGDVARRVSELQKAGTEVAADSKLAEQIRVLGMNPEDLKFADTAAEQAARGQRAMLTYFANTRWEKTIYGGAPLYQALDVLGTGIKSSKVAQVIGKVFSTNTSDEAFNAVQEHYTNLLDYRNGKAMQQAVDIQRELGALPEGDAQKVIQAIETGTPTGVDAIDNVAYKLRVNFDEMKDVETKAGLINSTIEDYFPHQLRAAGDPQAEQTIWSKIKGMFYNAEGQYVEDAAQQGFGDAKVYSTKLDAANARKYEGTIAEIKQNFGIDFEDRPAIAYARRALGSSKAVTSAEFFDSVKQFGKPVDAVTDAKSFLFGPTGQNAGTDIERAIAAGDIPRDMIYQGTSDLLKPEYATGRIQDLASKLDELQGGLGQTFKDSVDVNKTTMQGIVDSANKLVDEVGPALGDATKNFVPVKAKELDGLKFSPDVARQIDAYYEKVRPQELNTALKMFDSVQNWWKAQALTAPSYHVRNFVGNMWNNFLAGVDNPEVYYQAGQLQMGKAVEFTDDAGRVWDNSSLMQAAKQSGVINEGWYAKDIETALGSETGGISFNPLKQNFALFQANKAAGSALENNARLALFIDQLKGGETIDNAAMTVKQYLFDYADLTWTEKNIFKRAIPFYTWTRKNIPLQLGALVTQPGKFAAIPKVINLVESGVKQPNEKYLGDYIKNNIGVRTGTDGKGNTMYFLLGSWLPAAQAIDFLSQPTDNFIQSVSPFLKTPIELWANKSTFFEDTFGQPSPIERYPQEQTSWLGLTMRKKTAYVLKNIRILNELDKLNPGAIFGDRKNPSLIHRIAPEAGFTLPGGIGTVTTSEKRFGQYTPDSTNMDRVLNSLFGKTTVYNPAYAKQFYLLDTQTKIEELNKAIKNAQREGQKDYAKRLHQELVNIEKSR